MHEGSEGDESEIEITTTAGAGGGATEQKSFLEKVQSEGKRAPQNSQVAEEIIELCFVKPSVSQLQSASAAVSLCVVLTFLIHPVGNDHPWRCQFLENRRPRTKLNRAKCFQEDADLDVSHHGWH